MLGWWPGPATSKDAGVSGSDPWIATTFPDTSEPLEILLFMLDRRHGIAEAVSALWIVEHLDIVEDVLPGLVAANVDLAANALRLESL